MNIMCKDYHRQYRENNTRVCIICNKNKNGSCYSGVNKKLCTVCEKRGKFIGPLIPSAIRKKRIAAHRQLCKGKKVRPQKEMTIQLIRKRKYMREYIYAKRHNLPWKWKEVTKKVKTSPIISNELMTIELIKKDYQEIVCETGKFLRCDVIVPVEELPRGGWCFNCRRDFSKLYNGQPKVIGC